MHIRGNGEPSGRPSSGKDSRVDFPVAAPLKRVILTPDCHCEASDGERVGAAKGPDPAEIVTALLQQCVPVRFIVAGPSMRPLLRDGDEVTVRPLGPDTPKRGQIVLFRQHARLTLHRFAGLEPDGRWRTVADAALEGAEIIQPGDALGVAVRRRRGVRERQLDGLFPRAMGLIRYAARPLRRWIASLRKAWSRRK